MALQIYSQADLGALCRRLSSVSSTVGIVPATRDPCERAGLSRSVGRYDGSAGRAKVSPQVDLDIVRSKLALVDVKIEQLHREIRRNQLSILRGTKVLVETPDLGECSLDLELEESQLVTGLGVIAGDSNARRDIVSTRS